MMTSFTEAVSKFGDVVRGAGGEIFRIEPAHIAGNGPEEKLQIGTPDGFVKVSVPLNQPNIDAVLRERIALLIKHADEFRMSSRPTLAASFAPGRPTGQVPVSRR